MSITKEYTSAIELTTDLWKYSKKSQRKELLKTLVFNSSWANTNSIKEMVKRGGGMVANALKELQRRYLASKVGYVKITWN